MCFLVTHLTICAMKRQYRIEKYLFEEKYFEGKPEQFSQKEFAWRGLLIAANALVQSKLGELSPRPLLIGSFTSGQYTLRSATIHQTCTIFRSHFDGFIYAP